MELKSYQNRVLSDIEAYLGALMVSTGVYSAWTQYWTDRGCDIGFPAYCDDLKGVPNVCIKVPTGGGKTLLAAASIKAIFNCLPLGRTKFVVWLVPSDAILTQTVANLSNPYHPYRQRLNRDFGGRVNVYTKEQLLNGQHFKPADVMENLSVAVFCYASIRVNAKSKDERKVYQENGNLLEFAQLFNDKTLHLADTPDTALLQVIRQLRPVVIVDESHNVKSTLSLEMLNHLNPSFVLAMTATPSERSNIITYVQALELKREHMVKLPVVLYNRPDRKRVLEDAVHLRGILEQRAKAAVTSGGSAVRPIVLFQAQPKTSEGVETFEKIKTKLVEMGIPKEEIAIKTAEKDELRSVDLMQPTCPIRYVITVNALKEGWDCPFAYILASLANKTSKVDVEQIVGRILRQPYARKHAESLLNMSYVFTCSADFHATINSVIDGLNGAGFSAKDYRVANPSEEVIGVQIPIGQDDFTQNVEKDTPPSPIVDSEDDFEDLTGATTVHPIQAGEGVTPSLNEIIQTAETQGLDYEEQTAALGNNHIEIIAGDPIMVKNYPMQTVFGETATVLEIPQFMVHDEGSFFTGAEGFHLLEESHLRAGFKITAQDATVPFTDGVQQVGCIDVRDGGDGTPKYKQLSASEINYFKACLTHTPDAERLKFFAQHIGTELDKRFNFLTPPSLKVYVERVLDQFPHATQESLSVELLPALTAVIQTKIEQLLETHQRKMFNDMLNDNRIVCKAHYQLPPTIALSKANNRIEKSLYIAENDSFNNEELAVLNGIVSKDNVVWWHRIKEKQGFCINGFLKHYPDFMVMTEKGNLILVEVKGGHLDGSDAQEKAELGQKWANLAGAHFKYFMIFQQGNGQVRSALSMDAFLSTLERL